MAISLSPSVIARSPDKNRDDMAIWERGSTENLYRVYPEWDKILRGVYPERDEILRFAQNDRKRRAQ